MHHDPTSKKQRLDRLLTEKGLAPTRSKARDLIKDGFVKVDGERVTKAGQVWSPNVQITLEEFAPDYVSRSALKLKHALDHFDVDVEGQIALDIGASTGGFTEVLLECGAAHVYAVDVGHDQLHEKLKNDQRVTSLEGQDARTLSTSHFASMPTALTADVSFISLSKALEVPMQLLQGGSWIIALIKPQFEVTKNDLNKKGVVKDKDVWQQAVNQSMKWFEDQPKWHVLGLSPSPIQGHAGNEEVLICVGKEDEA